MVTKRRIMMVIVVFAATLASGWSVAIGSGPGWDVEAPLARAILDSFPSPGITPGCLDWDPGAGGVLYHVDQYSTDVYSITPDGVATLLFNIATQIGVPEANWIGMGICYIEASGELFITDPYGHTGNPSDMVYRFALDGTLIDSYDVTAICPGIMGACFDGAHFWICSMTNYQIVECDQSFSPIAVYAAPAVHPAGMDYDPETNLFYVADCFSGWIYICNSAMNVVDSFLVTPFGNGVAIGRSIRGRTLWCSSGVTDHIYEIEDEYYSPVESRTWGSIKAMFR